MTYDDYLRLIGLLTLARDHCTMLKQIEKSALALVGLPPDDLGHVSDAIWGENYTPERLLELLGIPVPAMPIEAIRKDE